MRKFLSIILIAAICFSSFSITAFAQEDKTIYSFEHEGNSIYYYKDKQGSPYIVDDGIKCYIAIPEYIEKVTDEAKLEQLRNEFNSVNLKTRATSEVLFSETVYFNPLASTGVFTVTYDYLYLKCTQLRPLGSNRGFSYWIFYSPDGDNWTRAFYANMSLTFYTRHDMALFGDGPFIKIEIFPYDGSVSSCLFSVKQGGVLG